MRALVLRSNLLLDIGYQQGAELICSSFGRDRVNLGPITYTGANGAIVRVGVRHPALAPDSPLIVVTDSKSGYAALVSQALLIDSVPNDGSETAGMISVASRRILAERGSFNPDWSRTIGDAFELTFYDGTNVVAWRRSAHTDYAAFAAIGPGRIHQHQNEILLLLMPVGLAAAGLLSFVMMRLARLPGPRADPAEERAQERAGSSFWSINRSWSCNRGSGAGLKPCCAGVDLAVSSSARKFLFRSLSTIT